MTKAQLIRQDAWATSLQAAIHLYRRTTLSESIAHMARSMPERPVPDTEPCQKLVIDLLGRIANTPVPATAVPWFLDVDGVLNAISRTDPDAWPEYDTTKVSATSGWGGTQRFPIRYAPGLIACLNLMAGMGLIEVRWLTTWEGQAATNLAPAIGLHVGDRLAGQRADVDFKGTSWTWWKAPILAAQVEADLLPLAIWTDDDLDMYREVDGYLEEHPEILSICPDMAIGLTPRDIELALDRINATASSAGLVDGVTGVTS